MGCVIPKNKRWVNGIVPFDLDKLDFGNEKGKIAMGIKDAIDDWNSRGLKVKLQRRDKEPSFLLFKINRFNSSGGSNAGMGFGLQIIWATETSDSTRSSTKSLMLHEIGHALGLYHENCRNDRDDFIDIHEENIEMIPFTPYFRNQFAKTQDGRDVGAYDFSSIMHYDSEEYTIKKGKFTITKKDGSRIRQARVLSSGDVEAVRELYSDIDQPQPFIEIGLAHGVSHTTGRVVQPPPITIDPPAVTIAPPTIHVKPPSITITPAKMRVQPPSVRFMGRDVSVPAMDVQPPSITVDPPAIDVSPNPVTIDPPPVTVTPPPIIIY